MDKDITPDEKPKKEVARKVVSKKRQYFVPEHGAVVEASDVDEAVEKAKKSANSAEEEGDG